MQSLEYDGWLFAGFEGGRGQITSAAPSSASRLYRRRLEGRQVCAGRELSFGDHLLQRYCRLYSHFSVKHTDAGREKILPTNYTALLSFMSLFKKRIDSVRLREILLGYVSGEQTDLA